MPNDKGEIIKKNVKLTETDLPRDTLIESVMRDNSLFKPDNDIIDLRRKSLIYGQPNIFGGSARYSGQGSFQSSNNSED